MSFFLVYDATADVHEPQIPSHVRICAYHRASLFLSIGPAEPLPAEALPAKPWPPGSNPEPTPSRH